MIRRTVETPHSGPTKHFLELKCAMPEAYDSLEFHYRKKWNLAAMDASIERMKETIARMNRFETVGKPKRGLTTEHSGMNRAMKRRLKHEK